MKINRIIPFILLTAIGTSLQAQPMASLNEADRGAVRQLRYKPDGEDFVINNGTKRFNRALYGTHTGFRVETGDVPEFALYMPRMGGNLSFGLTNKAGLTLPLNNAENIESRYRPGSRIYKITDPLLGNGEIQLTALAMADADGMILKIQTLNIPRGITLSWRFGGAADKRFSREGDLGVDPADCFDLKPEYCTGNKYAVSANTFKVNYAKGHEKALVGTFPPKSVLKIEESLPVLDARLDISGTHTWYLAIQNPDTKALMPYKQLSACFDAAEEARAKLAAQVQINTPDPYFNTLGGALAMAADGIWSGEVWLHGAVGWRMPLSGWRAAYTGDALGWHDRARIHFDAYAASQVTDVPPIYPHPTQDPEMNLARAEKKWGTQMYSNGYICRNPNQNDKMHHYDMNLCYIDELLWHLMWTGDLAYARRMWPVLQRHLDWEKRNFDPDGDGLYNAYCCIWASDALQYNSGGATHSTAYNYRANKIAARIAGLIGEDAAPYQAEADKILNALNTHLWMPQKGYWAEFKDFMGYKKLHESAAIWSIYHAIDSDVHDPFQAYQATRYIDTGIPHIPVQAEGLTDEGYATIATTNWLPYSWSINNVAFAEVMHTTLAYWQAGRNDEAYKLLKSSILDGMYLGSSPGNFGQVSFYDAARGECYRDFGDPVGVASRVLIQGLFGVLPDALSGHLVLRPGFPAEWETARLHTADIDFNFNRVGKRDTYTVDMNFPKPLSLCLLVGANGNRITSLSVNGKPASWEMDETSVGAPRIRIDAEVADTYRVEIEWEGEVAALPSYSPVVARGDAWTIRSGNIQELFDPQQLLAEVKKQEGQVSGVMNGNAGHHTLFVRLQDGTLNWWSPVDVEVKEPIHISWVSEESETAEVIVTNHNTQPLQATLTVNPGTSSWSMPLVVEGGKATAAIRIPQSAVWFGTNKFRVEGADGQVLAEALLTNWNLPLAGAANYEPLHIENLFNAHVTQLFKNEYLTPRSPYTTLQVPKQGIGEWCHPKTTADIDDTGLREKIVDGILTTEIGLPFRSPKTGDNIAFTTLWDNYPGSLSVPLSGKASHAYLLMAGSTNHMQCRFVNGTVTVCYTDGSQELLELVNPQNWCPIEQDFFVDGKAFQLNAPPAYRLHLKSGMLSRNLGKELGIKGVYGRPIDGGAGILVDIPLDGTKELKELRLEVLANEVVMGIMGVTLQR